MIFSQQDLIKLVVAIFVGAIIGIEREWHNNIV